jgi:hypothetical protein
LITPLVIISRSAYSLNENPSFVLTLIMIFFISGKFRIKDEHYLNDFDKIAEICCLKSFFVVEILLAKMFGMQMNELVIIHRILHE